jgi:hypothetical protein
VHPPVPNSHGDGCPTATLNLEKIQVTRIKRNPCLGWEIFKIESKQMREICFLKFGNTVKTGNCLWRRSACNNSWTLLLNWGVKFQSLGSVVLWSLSLISRPLSYAVGQIPRNRGVRRIRVGHVGNNGYKGTRPWTVK